MEKSIVLNEMEKKVLGLAITYPTLEDQLGDNYSDAIIRTAMDDLDLTKHQATGYMGSLTNKGLVSVESFEDAKDRMYPDRIEGVDAMFWATEEGVKEYFKK